MLKQKTRIYLLLFYFFIGTIHTCIGQTVPSDTKFPVLKAQSVESRTYNDYQYALFGISILWNAGGFVVWLATPLNRSIANGTESKVPKKSVQKAAFYAILCLWMSLWTAPISLAAHFLDVKFGFATNGLGIWFLDRFRNYLFEWTGIPVVLFGYWLYEKSPRKWWLWVWLGSIPWQLFSIVLYPVFVAPAYNSFQTLPPGDLRTKLLAEANSAGLKDPNIFVVNSSIRTTRLNAYVSGIGPSKRIVIWDTMLKSFSDDEIMAVMGHELGHAVEGHLWWRLYSGIVGAGIILWLLANGLPVVFRVTSAKWNTSGISDIRGLPVVMLILFVVLIIQQPIESAMTRYTEHRADLFGLRLTGKRLSTASAFIKFADHDYADTDPPRWAVLWFYSHPPIRERIETVKEFRAITCCKAD